MKRLFAAALLCAALICGSIWSINAVRSITETVILDVENDRLIQADTRWKDAQPLLGALLLHDEIDQADQLFDRVLAAQSAGCTEDLTLDRAELLSCLRHLPDLQKPSLKNLL